jgi:hypothetical protein
MNTSIRPPEGSGSRFRAIVIGTALLLVIISLAALLQQHGILTFLPGTQPGSVDPMEDFRTCRSCHQSSSAARPVSITRDWYGSMMAQSARDPLFYAALAATNKYNNSAGEWCIRCHSPGGWLAGHSKVPTGQDLVGTDLDGIQCDYCHRASDQLLPDSLVPYLAFPVPGRGNGMHVMQRFAAPKRGPYDSVSAPHETMRTGFLSTSELCATCHDISNPFYAGDRITQPPHTYSPVERTYSEWLLSWFSEQGEAGTCQACHMKSTTGYGCVLPSAPERTDLRTHDLTGGNTFVQDILPAFWTGLDTGALQSGKLRAVAMLRQAAILGGQAVRESASVHASIRITNLTGHKLPTGYSEGRRMWLNVIGRDSTGVVVFESGKYLADSGKLVRDGQIKVYETVHGLTDSIAILNSLPAGPSFHFGLNDTILFDNRIPPKGFINARFRERLAGPVGAVYADSQYWDITDYFLPAGTSTITVTLLYQTTSKEYIEFLRNENAGNPYDLNQYGEKLYDAWSMNGRCMPVSMAETTITVQDGATGVLQEQLFPTHESFALGQNYPNPFNPETVISFEVRATSHITLEVFDLLGRRVSVLVDQTLPQGTFASRWDAARMPGGIYFYRLTSSSMIDPGNPRSAARKMLLLR